MEGGAGGIPPQNIILGFLEPSSAASNHPAKWARQVIGQGRRKLFQLTLFRRPLR
jgi:hypothetical protein